MTDKARPVLFMLYFFVLTNAQLFAKMDLNLQYGNVLIEDLKGQIKSKIECAVACQASKSGLPCDAFIFNGDNCQLIYVWSLTESSVDLGEMQQVYVKTSAILEKCPAKMIIHSSDTFDCMNFESLDLNCDPGNYAANLALLKVNQACGIIKGQVWLGQLYQPDQFIIFDLGCWRQVSEIVLENSYCASLTDDGKLKTNW